MIFCVNFKLCTVLTPTPKNSRMQIAHWGTGNSSKSWHTCKRLPAVRPPRHQTHTVPVGILLGKKFTLIKTTRDWGSPRWLKYVLNIITLTYAAVLTHPREALGVPLIRLTRIFGFHVPNLIRYISSFTRFVCSSSLSAPRGTFTTTSIRWHVANPF